MPGGWHILNPSLAVARLADVDPEERERVEDALDALLEDPYHPPNLTAHRMRGRHRLDLVDPCDPPARRRQVPRPDEILYVAYLPGSWYLTYTIHPNGLPPIGERLIRLRALVRQEI